ncbi:MFS general substrate transporter [Periconia macrospinosa]|uniref:MFS general substrate transporter n=1 Tax=Periconia macrospinosa TaxID=97972 RepID=A0A2V1DTN4_9PLEO|nr:MFS general substrate transporter [Periconia macrospinosa]
MVSTESATTQTSPSVEQKDEEKNESPSTIAKPDKDFRFWMIVVALCMTGLLGALENTVVTTSLPTIVAALNVGEDYVWITNVFFLTSAVVQPLFGQVANSFGRRWLAISIVAIYTLGSGICGGANSGGMLIAGRAIQGIGSGGVNMIVDVIVSDLVPLRQRGNYIAIVLTVYSIGTSRWVFYINLPVGGTALVMLYLFLRVEWNKQAAFSERIRKIDFIGNGILMASTVSILLGLTYAGARYPWSSWHIIVPLVLGFIGYGIFAVFEGSSLCKEPVVPLRLFSHRTALIIYFNTFLNSTLLYWAMFFLPVYFQGVLLSSASRAGVQMLPIVLVAVPGAIVAVIILSKYGRYKHLHIVGFALMTLGLGLFSIMDDSSPMAEWVIFQVLAALGSDMILNTLLPAFQAGIEEKDQAAATASWSFIRSFGNVWGVAIPAAIFNNQFFDEARSIDDPTSKTLVSGARAYEHATRNFVNSFSEPAKQQIIDAFIVSLKLVWQIAIAFTCLAFVLSFFEKEIPLRNELDTEFGMEGKKEGEQSVEKPVAI